MNMARREAGEPFWRISVDEAREMLYGGNAVVIDVRDPNEWAAGHVKGAIHVPVDDVLARIGELPRDKDLLFICAQGVRSGLACEIAASMGLDPENLYNIEDGTPKWIANRLPTSRGNNP